MKTKCNLTHAELVEIATLLYKKKQKLENESSLITEELYSITESLKVFEELIIEFERE